jgi:hypothetical protein
LVLLFWSPAIKAESLNKDERINPGLWAIIPQLYLLLRGQEQLFGEDLGRNVQLLSGTRPGTYFFQG